MEKDIFVPANFLEVCQGMQEALAIQSSNLADAGEEACKILSDNVSYYGSNKLELHAHAAYGLPDDLTMESKFWPVVSYGEVRINGYLSNVAHVKLGAINTIAWMMTSIYFRDKYLMKLDDEDFEVTLENSEKMSKRPLYVPVGLIESVLIAS